MHALGRTLAALILSASALACARSEPKTTATPTAAPAADTFCLADEHGTLEKNAAADALLSLDAQFLKAHTRARAVECRRLESESLVMRFSFGRLDARLRGKPLLGGSVDVLPREFHAVKDVSHAVFLAGLLFEDTSSERAARVTSARSAVDGTIALLREGSTESAKRIPPSLLSAQLHILEETRAALAAFEKGELDAAGQRAYFEKVRPDIHANLRAISGALVRGLDAAVKRARAEADAVDPKAWDKLLVIVTVSHQARAREIGVQYFQRLLKERPGEGARNEQRLVVSEGLWKPAQQYGLLVAHIVDQVGSDQVFGDPMRLQWDVLSDDDGSLDRLLPQ